MVGVFPPHNKKYGILWDSCVSTFLFCLCWMVLLNVEYPVWHCWFFIVSNAVVIQLVVSPHRVGGVVAGDGHGVGVHPRVLLRHWLFIVFGGLFLNFSCSYMAWPIIVFPLSTGDQMCLIVDWEVLGSFLTSCPTCSSPCFCCTMAPH